MRNLAAALLALPFLGLGQPSVSCVAPVAAVTWTANPAYPQIYLRIEPNPDGRTTPHPYPAPGFTAAMQVGPVSGGTFNLPATAGPWLAYAFQNSPYVEFPAIQFVCAAAPTPPPTPTPGPTPAPAAGITIVLVGKPFAPGTCIVGEVFNATTGMCEQTFIGVTTLRLALGDGMATGTQVGGVLTVQVDAQTQKVGQ